MRFMSALVLVAVGVFTGASSVGVAAISPTQVEQLSEQIVAKDANTRVQAIRRAKALGPDAAPLVQPLITRLDDHEKVFANERKYTTPSREAVRALIAIGNGAVPALIDELGADSKTRRANAAMALARISDKGRSAVIAAAAAGKLEPFFAGTALFRGTDESVAELVKLVEHGDAQVRLRAIHTLGSMQPGPASRAIPALIETMDAKDDQVAYASAEALAGFSRRIC